MNLIMKLTYKFSTIIITGLMISLCACQEPDTATPAPSTTSSNLSANFLFINASADAPSLDLYVNNLKTGESEAFLTGQQGYTNVPITTNGIGANTNVRAKATSGTINGVLGSNDLIFRAGNNNSNNFIASNGARYTFIAVDTINRPSPLRTINAGNFGDTTFYNTVNGQQLSVVDRATLPTTAKAKLVPIGTVPLGSSDPGGVRFLMLTDTYPSFANGNSTKAGIRFVHASPNSSSLWIRLRPTAGGANIILGNLSYAMSFPTFSPSVGSRSATSAFSLPDIAIAGIPIVCTLEVSTTSNFSTIVVSVPNVTFTAGKIYTIFIGGLATKTDNRKLGVGIVQHN